MIYLAVLVFPIRIRTGVGVPLKGAGPASRG
jgi:hypothetical protein